MLDDDPGTPPSTQPLLASASWLPLRQHIPMQPLSRAKEEEPADTQSLLLLMEEKWCGADRVFARARQFSLLRRFVHTRAQRVRAGAVHVHRTSGALGQSRGSLLAGICAGCGTAPCAGVPAVAGVPYRCVRTCVPGTAHSPAPRRVRCRRAFARCRPVLLSRLAGCAAPGQRVCPWGRMRTFRTYHTARLGASQPRSSRRAWPARHAPTLPAASRAVPERAIWG